MLRQRCELGGGIGCRFAGDGRFQQPLCDEIGKSAIWRGRMGVVAHREREMTRGLLARQLQIIYDGGIIAAWMDSDPSIATSGRAAAEALIDAAL